MDETLDADYMQAVTRELREAGWYPPRTYLCGCQSGHLCAGHASQRAVDHYHPETIRP